MTVIILLHEASVLCKLLISSLKIFQRYVFKSYDLIKLVICNGSSRTLLIEAGIFIRVAVKNALTIGIVNVTASVDAKATEFHLLSLLSHQCKFNTEKTKIQITF